MKKILSFITLSVLLIVGFTHNSVMVFAEYDNNQIETESNNSCCHDDNSNNKKCTDSCCIENGVDGLLVALSNGSLKKKILKSSKDITIFIFGLDKLDYRNLANITSPPYFSREISNYSYHTLINIIKSTT